MKQIPYLFLLLISPLFFTSCSENIPEKTLINAEACAGESEISSLRYNRYAEEAIKTGYPNFARLFRVLAKIEDIQLSNYISILEKYGKKYKPAQEVIQVDDVKANLYTSKTMNAYEISSVYPVYIEEAEKENFLKAHLFFTWSLHSEEEQNRMIQEGIELLEKDSSDINFTKAWLLCSKCGCVYKKTPDFINCSICGMHKQECISFE